MMKSVDYGNHIRVGIRHRNEFKSQYEFLKIGSVTMAFERDEVIPNMLVLLIHITQVVATK